MIKRAAAALAFVGPVVLLSACATDEQADDQQTTSPTTTTETAPQGDQLTAQLRTADGTPVAEATFDFADGFATVTVETVTAGILTPGFHGMHLHAVGQCEPDSVSPTGGPPGNFNSAGGHFHLPDSGHPASGDLVPLQVRADGSARVQTTTDAFTAQDLLDADGTALIIHEGPDNFAHIPPRYTIDGTPGPDQETLDTGDAGARFACGVIEGNAGATATETVTETTVPPPAPGAPAPAPAPAEETTPPAETTTPETTVPETTTPETTTPETTTPTETTTTTAPEGPLPGPAPGN
ncbi:superoxide dismutase[Cu-Zn] [[Mycobacterium] wendilense]|uniref:Superoxide dismutase [Cu-Zn] n=1 Tax=[Mycobacterium] wendilense TaxID=3064284 RepID=A0ABN9NVB3_9MYCO|nr:superoxide dismutase family protein [Mycolicibacterium sp. MU0050]CAJ1580330.1 superoxide dismutase family protein [Mycolicibacterium sp. MU0050]